MSLNRRALLSLSAAGAVGVGASLLGTGSALAATAPTNPFPIGVRQYNWTRGSRQVTTYVYYPAATGTPGGAPVTNAPVANGVFPICEYTHGSGASPQRAQEQIRPLAAAGFIVPAPVFGSSIGEAYNGNLSKDVSEVLTRTIALNSGSDPLAGHINTAAVGVSGYSMGGMTTHGLLTAWPDSRIKAAVPVACVDMGNPGGTVNANVLFIHGDQDTVCPLSSARQAYAELSSPKAFLTFVGADHGGTGWGATNGVAMRTWVDWMRWSLYGDTAARDRLPADATGSGARWESSLGSTPTEPGTYRLIAQHSGKYADINGISTAAGALLHQWSGTGRTNQQFQFVDAGDGHFKIKASHSGLVLQVASNSNGADITQQADTNAHSQHWRLTDHGNNVVSIINRQSGLAMDVYERSTADGARISQYTPNGGTNQRFTRQAV
ncbi:RICIN domain-containing protein [Glycomyces sp. NPDC021274]|uniref:RICIN domain-containing protein n=1 Tax=Glycomyces sp. NPDC021274 TaxID=3155120 RepID=UPI0033D29567